jgi:23S rRNA (cytidine1920-2'-O)/16S rRNA (cytidine1409-2'-O)-methyltransferase
VRVDGTPVLKSSQRVAADAELTVEGLDHYVARSAHKLIGALDAFAAVRVEGVLALDVGASTGGFTQVLLERGAREVIALDVGHGQIVPRLRGDDRVRVVEGVNARELTPELLAASSGTAEPPQLIVADLSFISLPTVLPALATVGVPEAEYVVLVKPQFEVGRQGVREGLVKDRAARHDAVSGVLWAAWDLGLPTAGLVSSPVLGSGGNQEYLVRLARDVGSNPTEWSRALDALP